MFVFQASNSLALSKGVDFPDALLICYLNPSSVHFMTFESLFVRLMTFGDFILIHIFVFSQLFQDRLSDWMLDLILVFQDGLYYFRLGDGFPGLRISFAGRGYCPLNSPKSCHLLQLWLALAFKPFKFVKILLSFPYINCTESKSPFAFRK